MRFQLLSLGVGVAVVVALGPLAAQCPVGVPDAVSEAVAEGLSADDWSSIRALQEARRHGVEAVDGGHRAHNPGQLWTTVFDGRGCTTTPDAGGWSWGLELVSYGRDGTERAVGEPRAVRAQGQELAYDWDERLTEWYVNDTRGLEHGYTVHTRPDGDGPLELELRVRGGLEARVSADGCDVCFAEVGGGPVLHYAGLTVLDSGGERVAAGFEATGTGLRLVVEDSGARYPLTIDPIAQQAYLKASNPDAQDVFGFSVAVSGDTVVVGSRQEASSATGVNGDQSDNSADDSGAAYVFVRNGNSWSQQAYLKASNTDDRDFFGGSVAVCGDTIVVGASGEDSNAAGVNGDQSNNSTESAGAAYVFVRNGNTWSQQAYLKASNPDLADHFGRSVAVSGDTVLVGADGESSGATGVNGNQSDNSVSGSGAAYVFVRSGNVWSQQAYLKASNTGGTDRFGASVSASGETIVVGAWSEDSNATGVNGDQSNDNALHSGAAYVFVRNGNAWSQQAYLKASNTNSADYFGWSVALSDDTIVVGALWEDSAATGVNGDQSSNSADKSGAAYVFVRNASNWSQQAYLKASNTDPDDYFGISVGATGDTVVVGAWWEGSSATGVDGDQSSNSSVEAGAAYVFVRTGNAWSQQAYLKASNTEAFDLFGCAAAVSGDTVVLGAYGEDSSSAGVNGDQSANDAAAAGAAYVFTGVGGPCDPPTSYCVTSPNSVGSGARMAVSGSTSIAANDLVLDAIAAPPSQFGLFFYGSSQTQLVLGDGFRCVGGTLFRLPVVVVDTLGRATVAVDYANLPPGGDVLVGSTWNFQFWYRDPGFGSFGFNLSDAIQAVFCD